MRCVTITILRLCKVLTEPYKLTSCPPLLFKQHDNLGTNHFKGAKKTVVEAAIRLLLDLEALI